MERVIVVNIFHRQLEDLLLSERSYKNLALRLGVSESSLKSWIINQRVPSIRSLDKVADNIGCFTYQLLKPAPLVFCAKNHNDSHKSLCRNLGMIFIQHQCFSVPQKLMLLQNQISDFALSSYLRSQNYKLPTLGKLEIIACALGIETYKLLYEED